MEYRCEATSVAGFIQQLAVAYIGHGYLFYVTGEIPERKDVRAVDRKLIAKYDLAIGKTTRARRKALGRANVQYLRYRRSFILLATAGSHTFFADERKNIRDVRDTPVKFGGYAVSYRAGHPHVRIEKHVFAELKAYFSNLALYRKREHLETELARLPFEPYAPVRGQVHCILRDVNRQRELAHYEVVSPSCIRTRRHIVKPFDETPVPSLEPFSAEQALEVRTVDGKTVSRFGH